MVLFGQSFAVCVAPVLSVGWLVVFLDSENILIAVPIASMLTLTYRVAQTNSSTTDSRPVDVVLELAWTGLYNVIDMIIC